MVSAAKKSGDRKLDHINADIWYATAAKVTNVKYVRKMEVGLTSNQVQAPSLHIAKLTLKHIPMHSICEIVKEEEKVINVLKN